MKFSAIICALLASSVAAFAPSCNEVRHRRSILLFCGLRIPCSLFQITLTFISLQRSTTALHMDRRAAVAAAVGMVVAAPQLAFADGAVSAATTLKSKTVYGARIAALKDAVDKGDFAAVADEKSAFVLFNSGAYPTAKSKAAKKAAIEGTNAIFAAVKSGDKAGLKSAYAAYVKANDVKGFPVVTTKSGQGYSSDYDYRRGTAAGAVYVR
jgi:Photosystem II Psb31 protein